MTVLWPNIFGDAKGNSCTDPEARGWALGHSKMFSTAPKPPLPGVEWAVQPQKSQYVRGRPCDFLLPLYSQYVRVILLWVGLKVINVLAFEFGQQLAPQTA